MSDSAALLLWLDTAPPGTPLGDDEERADLLPVELAAVARVVSLDAAYALATAFGGRLMRIPAPARLSVAHPLVHTLDIARARLVCQELAGIEVTWPRAIPFCRAWRLRFVADLGGTANQLAETVGCDVRYVRRMIAAMPEVARRRREALAARPARGAAPEAPACDHAPAADPDPVRAAIVAARLGIGPAGQANPGPKQGKCPVCGHLSRRRASRRRAGADPAARQPDLFSWAGLDLPAQLPPPPAARAA